MPSNIAIPGDNGAARGDSNGMSSVLKQHYLGVHKMRLSNITCTEMVRPLNENGLKHLQRSIREVGWLEQFAPSVLIQRDRLGNEDQITADVALAMVGRVLDGNHRITALKREFDHDTAFAMRVYLEFNQAEERLIANALNDATDNVVQRTLYDKVYFQHELEEAIKRETKKKNVSQADIRRMYERVGAAAPPKTTLRNWQLGVNALHPESFDVLKEVCESSEAEVDGNAVTLTYLIREEFRDFSPLKQGLCIRLLSRFKHLNKRAPTSKDYDAIDEDAHVSETFVENVNRVVPSDKWTPELRREVNRLSFEKANQLDTYVKPHNRERKEEVEKLLDKVSAGDQNSSHVVQLKDSISTVVACEPLPRIRAILSNDATLRHHLLSWDANYQDVINQVNLHKVHCGTDGTGDDLGASSNDNVGTGLVPSGGGGGDDDGRENGGRNDGQRDRGDGDGAPKGGNDHGGWNKGVCCPSCKPPPTARYCCPKCSITHIGECANANIVGDERAKDRVCIDCPRSQHGSEGTGRVGNDAAGRGKGKGKGKGACGGRGASMDTRSRPNLLRAPSSGETADMEKCMADNTALHDIHPLDPTRGDLDVFTFRNPPKLAIVSIAAEPRLLKDTEATNSHLRKVIDNMHTKMHPEGTMALVVPHPWGVHFHRLQAAVREARVGLVVEDHPLLLNYIKRGGGRPAAGTENHLRNHVDMILIVHTEGTAFTCNKRVTADDTFGHGTDASPSVLQSMYDLQYKGAAKDIPMRPLHFLINRYTNAGDTVVSLSAERHNVVEGALQRSRRVEVFVSNVQSKDEVRDNMKISFGRAYKDGKWKVSTSLIKERVIGPSCLPAALGTTLVPSETQRFVAEASSPEGAAMGRDNAALHVATEVAKAFGYDLENAQPPEGSSSSDPAGATILPLRGKDYHVNANDLPAWGDLEVFNSRTDAFRSLSLEEQEDQCIRLLHVANNFQLKRMLLPGTEVCGPGAELYLRVAATCPLYYMRWTEDADQANVEFTSKVPQSGSRADVLLPFSQAGAGQAFVTPVIGRVFKPRAKNDPRSPFRVLPGLTVVRSRGFKVRDSDSDSSSTPVTTRKRKRSFSRTSGEGKSSSGAEIKLHLRYFQLYMSVPRT